MKSLQMTRWLAAVALALNCAAAQAQLKPVLDLYIEKYNPEVGDCGIASQPLQQVSTLTLENSGIRVVQDAPVFLYVQPVVLQQGDACFVHLDASVRTRRQVPGFEGFKVKEGWVGVLLCSATVSGIVQKDELGSAFLNQLVQQIKLCLDTLEF